MIQTSSEAVMVLRGDGVTVSFDPAELQAAILECFEATGTPESYLAEDAALAVEFAMKSSRRPRKVFTESEINTAAVKVLEQAGLAEVASLFSRRNSGIKLSLSAQRQLIHTLLERHLSSLENRDLDDLTDHVVNAVNLLKIREAQPALYLELARYFQDNTSGIELPELPAPPPEDAFETLSLTEISGTLPAGAIRLINEKILSVAPVSSIFKTLRITIKICRLAESMCLKPPITEMMISSELFRIGRILNNTVLSIQALYSTKTGSDYELPVYIMVPDLEKFAVEWLEWSWPDAENACRELLLPFACPGANLRYK